MIRKITDEDFASEVRENNEPIVVMFTGSWCQPCKQMKPTFETLSNQMKDIRFAEMDIEHSGTAATEFGIRSVPSLVLLVDGMIREIHVGTMNQSNLRSWISENV